MPVLPLMRFSAGLSTSVLDATQEHVADSINMFTREGQLQKRSGDTPLQVVDGPTAAPYLGVGEDAALPVSTTTGGAVTAVSNENVIYVGHSAVFNRFKISADCLAFAHADLDVGTLYTGQRALTVEYWNGSAWAAVSANPLHAPSYDAANDVRWLSPFCGVIPTTAVNTNARMLDYALPPPTDWAARTVGGNSKFWVRITGLLPLGSLGAVLAQLNGATSYVYPQESRVLHLNVFQDRIGARHVFAAYLYGGDGKNLRFTMDGVVMTQSAGLQPDGNSVMFSPSTRVWSFYHAATDRVIGYVSGLGYFFFLANGQTRVSSADYHEIYSFEPDDVATDTQYESFQDGLRSQIPPAAVMTMHDGRIFIANGQTIYWSAPGPFADVWPQSNERLLGDAGGNITGMASVGGVLVIFKRNSIWVAQSDGSDEGYNPYAIPGGAGCVAPLSVSVAGNVCYFLAEDGVYSFEGQSVARLTGAIDDVFKDRAWSSSWENAVGVYLSTYSQYRLFYQSGGSGGGVLDSALYADLSGYAVRVHGEIERGVSWWRQGSYASTDYGFQTTAVCVDNTADENVMVLGDRFGVIRECDAGVYDGGSAVKASMVSQRIGLGGSRKVVLRRLTTTQDNSGNYSWSLKAWGEGEENTKQTNTVNPYLVADGSVWIAAGVWVDGAAFAYSSAQSTVQSSVAFTGRFFQVEILEPNAAPWVFHGMEAEVNVLGRRE